MSYLQQLERSPLWNLKLTPSPMVIYNSFEKPHGSTLPETNIAPENQWLEDYFPFGEAYFQGRLLLVSGRVKKAGFWFSETHSHEDVTETRLIQGYLLLDLRSISSTGWSNPRHPNTY